MGGERHAELAADERVRVQGDDETDTGPVGRQAADRLGDPAEAAVPVLPTMGGHDDVRLAGVDRCGDRWILERQIEPGREPQRVDAGVAGHEDLLVAHALADEVLPVDGGRRQVEGGDPRDQLPVELLGERGQRRPGAQPRLDVADGDPEVEGGQRGCERRRRVAVDERRYREPVAADLGPRGDGSARRTEALAAEGVEALDHDADEVVEREAGMADPQVDVGLDPGELEDRLDEVAGAARW